MSVATTKTRPRVLGEDQLLKTGQVAKMLACSGELVRQLIASGQLPHTAAGSHYRVWKSDVDALVKGNQRGG